MAEHGLRRRLGIGGCLLLVLLLVSAVVVVSVFAYRSYRDHLLHAEDPEARTAQALEILGGNRLPAGYHAMAAMTMPGMLQAVVLSDSAPGEDGRIDQFDAGLFLYMESRGGEISREDLLNLWPGDLSLDQGDSLRDGIVRHAGVDIGYSSSRGDLVHGHRRLEGVFAELSFRCVDGGRQRSGLWFRTVPAARAIGPLPAATTLLGGPADPSALEQFTGSMDPCGE